MKKNKLFETSIFAGALIGIIILLNILSLGFFSRMDLTANKQYTLSEASRTTVDQLEDRLTIKAYFSEDLPAPYSTNARFVRDLLDEYYNASNGNLSYEFLDPVAQESEEDKEKRKDVKRDIFGRAIRQETDVEMELRSEGIQPVEVRVNEGDNLEVKRVYMGISLHYGDQQEAIPVITDISKLEYDLTTLIRKLSRTKVPVLGVITGRNGLDERQDLGSVLGLLRQQYEVQMVNLTDNPTIPDTIDAILVTGPGEAFTPEETQVMEDFIREGHSAAFLPDAVRIDLSTTQSTPLTHGLDSLLEKFGVHIKPGLVLDAQCAQINVTEQRGFMRIQRPVQFPFLPVVEKLDQDSPLLSGLSHISFPFVSPLELIPHDDIEGTVLVESSEQSWIQEPPFDLNPLQRWPASIAFDGPHPLAVALSGGGTTDEAEDDAHASWRILVIGTSSIIQNQFMTDSSQALALNLVDWLMQDDAMFKIRSRGLTEAPLEEISDGRRNALKYGNILGVPLLFIIFGIVRWRMRERRRKLIATTGGLF